MSVTKVVLAKLSPTMEEGTVVKWNKSEGDVVKVGDVLAEIETDKANMEMEALGAGILRKILIPAGGKAPVGQLIGVIANADEDISSLLAAAPAVPAAPATPAAPSPPPKQETARVPQPTVPPPAPSDSGGRVKASPLARSMATRQNIALSAVAGSGPGGRIIKRDVEAFTSSGGASAAPGVTAGQEIPVSSMRKAIAKRLSDSMFTAPHYYVTVEVDMDATVAAREQLIRGENVKVSYNDFIVKACAKALARFPMVNASWRGDTITTFSGVHVAVAVALPDGLITPVVRDADRKSLIEIASEVKDLAARAKERKLRPEEYSDSTFSISNLGMYDVTAFTAIINPPGSAILAVGAVRQVPVVKDGAIAIGHRMNVTLGCDHRVIDGAVGAEFLAEVRRLLENPVSLFV